MHAVGYLSRVIAAVVWCTAFGADYATRAEGPPLRFGMSTTLTGPASDLGHAMRDGVRAAFDEQNRVGGIRGRQLELIVLDDGYEPARTAPNMRRLIEAEDVLAVVGNVGTPTAVVAIPIANETGTPFVGAFTGAGVLRKSPPDRYVVNVRASYAQETAAMVEALIASGIRPDEIGFFTQRDAYGAAGLTYGIAALERHAPGVGRNLALGSYERNTLAVEGALADLLSHRPEPKAVIMVGAYAPCARFIQVARDVGFEPRFLNVSFVGAKSLARELGDAGNGVVITQVVPHPDSDAPIAAAAAKALRLERGDLGFGALEGYAVGRMTILALERIRGEISRETLIVALESLGTFDLGLGTPLNLSAQRHQASDQVWPTVIRAGRVQATTWPEALRGEEAPQ